MVYILPFLAVVASNLYFVGRGSLKGVHITKPLLMPLLLLFYLITANVPDYFIILALICGFLGDVLLMCSGKNSFLLGAGCFLLGHLAYIAALLRHWQGISGVPLLSYVFMVPYVLYGAYIYDYYVRSDGRGDKGMIAYMAAILTMSFTSLLRVWHFHGAAFWLPFAGSLLFIFSDTLLALPQISVKRFNRNVTVMLTYCSAQLLLVVGLMQGI